MSQYNKNVTISFQTSLCCHHITRLGLWQDGRGSKSSQRAFELRLSQTSDLSILQTIKLGRFEGKNIFLVHAKRIAVATYHKK